MASLVVEERNRTRRRHWGAAAGAASAGLLLAACGAPSSDTGGPAAGQPVAKVPALIRLGERAGTEEQAFDVRLPAFAARFPWITVQREVIAGDLIVALKTMAASDTLPDNLHSYTGSQSYHQFAVGGATLQVDAYVARDKLDLKGWFPEMVEIMKIDGRLFGLPFKGQVLAAGFFYNLNLFQQRGLPLPTDTWSLDDVVTAAQQLTQRQGADTVQWGYAVQTWGGENFTAHLRQWGGDTFAQGGKRAALDTPHALEALQWYEHLLQRERLMHPLADAVKDFVEGRVAMLGRPYFNLKTNDLLPKVGDAFLWESAMMPRHPKTGRRGGMFSGDAHSIARTSGAPDAAFELLKWLTDREFGVALGLQSKGSTTLGGRPDVYADERILNHPQLSRQTQQAQLKSVSEIKEPFAASHNYRNPEVEQARDAGTTKIANGEQKAEPGFLRSLNGELQAILDLPRL